jgi:hypothetical protein
MQGLEGRRSFCSVCLKRAKCRPVSVNPSGIASPGIQRLKHLGSALSTFHDKGAYRTERVS